MDSLKLSRAIEETESQGGRLFSIVHTHINCGAYFSDEDKIQMSIPDRSETVFPAFCYLVVSIQDRKPTENAVFVFDKEKQDYQECRLEIV